MKQKQNVSQRILDLFEMDEDDEEYQPDEKERAYLNKRRKKEREFLGLSETVKKEVKFLSIRTEDALRERIHNVMKERRLKEVTLRLRSREVLERMKNKGKKGDTGLIHFAGRLYRLNEKGEMVEHMEDPKEKGLKDLMQLANKYKQEEKEETLEEKESIKKISQEKEYRELLLERQHNLQSLISLLNHRHKSVSAIFKSRIDWKKFTNMNNLNRTFDQNRKSGYIEDQRFINRMAVKEKKKFKDSK